MVTIKGLSLILNKINEEIVKNMNELIDKFGSADILLIGDIMLDRFIYGDVNRISPEGPVPILSIKRENEMLGGAGNVWANMTALGAKADIISVIGQDEAGAIITKTIQNNDGLIVDIARPTILKTRYIAQNQQLLRVDHENNLAISPAVEKEILTKASALIKNKKILVLSDYGKGVLTDNLTKSLIKLAHDNKVMVIIDPKGKDYSKYNKADIITPNKKELSESTNGAPISSDKEIEIAAHLLIKNHDIQTVIATRSENGMSVIEKNKSTHIPTKAREIYDVSGAGDTVLATLATALAVGASLGQAAELANITAGLAVAKIGTAVITKAELQKEIQSHLHHNKPSFLSPVLNEKEAIEQIQKWQAQGLKIGLTNGCFDIIHFGHVNYLSRAREKCDRLVVALNHDKSVKLLKGENRPINDEKARAAVMAALGSCDMVVFFGAQNKDEDNTPSTLIGRLKPDIFFKGGDYSIERLPESKIVMSYGGIVEIMPLYDGYSTTNIIEKTAQS